MSAPTRAADPVVVAGVQVDPALFDFVEKEALAGSGLAPGMFETWPLVAGAGPAVSQSGMPT